MPEGEQVEDGSDEDLGFMNEILKKFSENVDPAHQTVITNIQKTELTQKQYILTQLRSELKVEQWQDQSKNGENNQVKIEAWNKLRTESIREAFYFIYITQAFLSCSYIVYSMTGKQLFEINAGKSNPESLSDLTKALENLENNNRDEPPQNQEELEHKRKMEQREKHTNVIHNHFMVLIFDVLTDFVKYLKRDVIDPIIDEELTGINLKSKFTLDQFKQEILTKIYERINDKLYEQYYDENAQMSGDDSDETDFDSEDDSDTTRPDSAQPVDPQLAIDAEVSKYRNVITAKLVGLFDKVDVAKYTAAVIRDLPELAEYREDMEACDPKKTLQDTVKTMQDYLETSYSQSIFIESVDFKFDRYLDEFSNTFLDTYNQNDQVFMAKIIPMLYRMRDNYNSTNPVLNDLENFRENEKPRENENNPEEEEGKVVELEDGEEDLEDQETRANEGQPVNQEETMETKIKQLKQSVKLFTKLVMTEGIENARSMPEGLGLGGDDMGELGPLLQSLMT